MSSFNVMCLGVRLRSLIWLLINLSLLWHQCQIHFMCMQWVSLQLMTKVPVPRHQMWSVFPLCGIRASIWDFACYYVNVIVKGKSIFTRRYQGGIVVILPTEKQHCYMTMHTYWSCFDSGFWHSLTVILSLYREQQQIEGFDKVFVAGLSLQTGLAVTLI